MGVVSYSSLGGSAGGGIATTARKVLACLCAGFCVFLIVAAVDSRAGPVPPPQVSDAFIFNFPPTNLFTVHGTVFSSFSTHSTLECQTPTVHVSTAPPGATSLLQPAAIVYRVNSWHACSRLDAVVKRIHFPFACTAGPPLEGMGPYTARRARGCYKALDALCKGRSRLVQDTHRDPQPKDHQDAGEDEVKGSIVPCGGQLLWQLRALVLVVRGIVREDRGWRSRHPV